MVQSSETCYGPGCRKDRDEDMTLRDTTPARSPAASRFESSLKGKLLARLGRLRRTPMEERWPGAVWPDAQAFGDADTFIRRLPLASIPIDRKSVV